MTRLVDNFGRRHTYLRISVTDRCNLRCRYCMPAEGIAFKSKQDILTFEEICRVASVFVKMGITKIRLTGGEPLVRRNLEELARSLAGISGVEILALTTNATLLAPKAQVLRDAGVSALNISLDTMKRERFNFISRRDDFQNVMQGIEAALNVGFPSLKLNMVVVSGFNDDEIVDFADFAHRHPVNVRFIEFMPFKDNDWASDKVICFKEMKESIEKYYTLAPLEAEPSAVAKDFAIVGGKGSVSFITSMSDSFCGTCNRLRLTADGSIKSCLFSPAEINLRIRLREGADDKEIEQMILYSLSLKPEAHPPAEEIAAQDNRAMIEIGG
ncbi:MAG TPA: GTP 3',8-cyclase MoaA [Candidatus Obscuribacterales bacterium]